MKFLVKHANSEILSQNLVYSNNTLKNRELSKLLQLEQKGFCAYTEKYIQGLDSICVEHFNASLKGTGRDNYYNYYAVLQKINIEKLDEQYKDASFFESLFFQKPNGFASRIHYIGGMYEELDSDDTEAKDLIAFLGLNNEELYKQRARHVKRIKKNFEIAEYDSPEKRLEYLRDDNDQLSFITALEIELNLDLSEFYT